MMKLTYFNVRGLAETTRMLFAVNNQTGDREEYEDFRYPLEVIDMKTHQMTKDEHTNTSLCNHPWYSAKPVREVRKGPQAIWIMVSLCPLQSNR